MPDSVQPPLETYVHGLSNQYVSFKWETTEGRFFYSAALKGMSYGHRMSYVFATFELTKWKYVLGRLRFPKWEIRASDQLEHLEAEIHNKALRQGIVPQQLLLDKTLLVLRPPVEAIFEQARQHQTQSRLRIVS